LRLPNPHRAVVDLAKIEDYCLNPAHEAGKHKARVFASALGLKRRDAEWLRQRLLDAVFGDAELLAETKFGRL
jgi:hypothetical protein